MSGYLAGLGFAAGGCCGTASSSAATSAFCGFHEVRGVLTGWVVGGEVGGAEEPFGIVGEVVCYCLLLAKGSSR